MPAAGEIKQPCQTRNQLFCNPARFRARLAAVKSDGLPLRRGTERFVVLRGIRQFCWVDRAIKCQLQV